MSKQIKLCRIKDINSKYECRYCRTADCGKDPCTNQKLYEVKEKKKKQFVAVDNKKLTAKVKELEALTSQ
jgi:hypothetical protein